jgi:hypothetical protein
MCSGSTTPATRPRSSCSDHGARVPLIHLKDAKELGTGPVNFDEIFAATDAVGAVEWFIVEQEHTTTPPEIRPPLLRADEGLGPRLNCGPIPSTTQPPPSCPAPSPSSPANGPTSRSKSSRPSSKQMGYDGVELACWGDHFDVDRPSPEEIRREVGAPRGPRPHLPGGLEPPGRPGGLRPDRRAPQGDPPAGRLGRRQPEGVRRRAAKKMIATAKAARQILRRQPGKAAGGFPAVVNGFTGSSIWHSLYAFPADLPGVLERASRTSPRWTRSSRPSTAWT